MHRLRAFGVLVADVAALMQQQTAVALAVAEQAPHTAVCVLQGLQECMCVPAIQYFGAKPVAWMPLAHCSSCPAAVVS